MTQLGFVAALTLLEGACGRDFSQKSRDAFWSILADYGDDEVMAASRRFAAGSDATRGLPTAAHLVALIDSERRYATATADATEPVSREEARAFVGQIREQLRSSGRLRLVQGGRR